MPWTSRVTRKAEASGMEAGVAVTSAWLPGLGQKRTFLQA